MKPAAFRQYSLPSGRTRRSEWDAESEKTGHSRGGDPDIERERRQSASPTERHQGCEASLVDTRSISASLALV